jgi:hypothetical protein
MRRNSEQAFMPQSNDQARAFIAEAVIGTARVTLHYAAMAVLVAAAIVLALSYFLPGLSALPVVITSICLSATSRLLQWKRDALVRRVIELA